MPAYYIAYTEESGNAAAEISQVYHPIEYTMAYWNKFQKVIRITWWKELTSKEEQLAVKVGAIPMNMLR